MSYKDDKFGQTIMTQETAVTKWYGYVTGCVGVALIGRSQFKSPHHEKSRLFLTQKEASDWTSKRVRINSDAGRHIAAWGQTAVTCRCYDHRY